MESLQSGQQDAPSAKKALKFELQTKEFGQHDVSPQAVVPAGHVAGDEITRAQPPPARMSERLKESRGMSRAMLAWAATEAARRERRNTVRTCMILIFEDEFDFQRKKKLD